MWMYLEIYSYGETIEKKYNLSPSCGVCVFLCINLIQEPLMVQY